MARDVFKGKELAEHSIYKGCNSFINLAGAECYVIDEGKGDPIVLLHGLGSSVYTWRGIIQPLSKNYRVIALDFKGAGFSEKPKGEYSVEVFTIQVLQLLDKLNIKKAVLAGNSLGGKVALSLCIRYPDRVKGLILIDSAGYQKGREKRGILLKLARFSAFPYILRPLITRGRIKRYIKSAFYNQSVINDRVIDSYYKPLKESGGLEALVKLCCNLSYEEFHFDAVKNIEASVLIIWGENDSWIPVSDAHKFAQALTKSEMHILEKCGHAPQEEYPEITTELIEGFLNKIYKP